MGRMMLTRKRVLIMLGVGVWAWLAIVFANGLRQTRDAAVMTICVHNLKLISIPLIMYAEEHGNRFPVKLSDLYPKYLTDLRCLICPVLRGHYEETMGKEYPFSDPPTAEEIDTFSSYVYVPGFGIGDDKDTVVAYERVDNHRGKGRALLYLDGRAFRKLPEDWPPVSPEAPSGAE